MENVFFFLNTVAFTTKEALVITKNKIVIDHKGSRSRHLIPIANTNRVTYICIYKKLYLGKLSVEENIKGDGKEFEIPAQKIKIFNKDPFCNHKQRITTCGLKTV